MVWEDDLKSSQLVSWGIDFIFVVCCLSPEDCRALNVKLLIICKNMKNGEFAQ